MPVKPKIKTLTNSSVDVINAIRNNATTNYREYVPIATSDAESIREIGAIIMDYPTLQNEFLHALITRIGKVIISSKQYTNPWAIFKKGYLEFGEVVEDIFVNLAKPFQYDPEVAEATVFKREIPDVRSAFYVLNYKKYYKTTVEQEQLRTAFLSWNGITELISKITESLYTAANYDEFLVMKYMLAKNMLNGRLAIVNSTSAPETYPKEVIKDVKDISNKLTFMSDKYNVAGVKTHTAKADQYVIVNSRFDAVMDVDVLASAFNMSKVEFAGHRVLVDGFGELDVARLNVLFDDDPTYTEINSDDLEALNGIPLIVVDKDYFMIFDNLNTFTEQYNGEGLYWNYWYHQWKTFAVSPFANAIMFVNGDSGITSVTVVPDAVTLDALFTGSVPLSAVVVATGYASQEVKYTISTDLSSYTKFHMSVNAAGIVSISHDSDADDTDIPDSVTIKCESVVDSTKYDEAVITFTHPEDGVGG